MVRDICQNLTNDGSILQILHFRPEIPASHSFKEQNVLFTSQTRTQLNMEKETGSQQKSDIIHNQMC
jgi:hypothetical protein